MEVIETREIFGLKGQQLCFIFVCIKSHRSSHRLDEETYKKNIRPICCRVIKSKTFFIYLFYRRKFKIKDIHRFYKIDSGVKS